MKYEIDRYLRILLDANNFPKFQIFVKSKYEKNESDNFYYMLKNHQSFRNPIRYQFCKIPNPYFLSIKDPTSKTHPQPSPTTATGG